MTNPAPNPVVAGIGTSIVRTVVPLLVGLLARFGAKYGLDLELNGAMDEAFTVIVTTLYYAVVRLLEVRIAPVWGWLLGVAKVPAYPTKTS